VSELIHAFVGEHRQAMVETRPAVEGLMLSNAAPCRLEADALAALRRLARALRDNSLFLGFPRLAAISRVLTDVLHIDDISRTELVLTASQAQLLVRGIELTDRIVEIVEAQQREPSTEVELTEFANAARTLGFAWEVTPFTPTSASRREELAGLSDAEKVEQLLVEESPLQAPPELAPVEVNAPSSAPDMVGIFAQDADEILDHAEQNLLHLEAEPDRLHDLLRQFHTLKGNSGLMGYSEMQRISHRLEDVLQLSRDRQAPLGADSVRLFLKAVDALRQCVASLRKGGNSSVPDFQAWLQRVDAWVGASDESPPAPAPESAVVEVAPPAPAAEPLPVAPAPVEEEAPEPQAAPKPAAQAGDGIRINVERLDQLNDLSSELIAATAVMMHLSKCREGVDSEQYEKACHHLDLITSWLQNLSMSMRMVPVELAFRRLHRLVRDLSEKTGKPIELQLVGGETEADRRVIEFIVDPLVHLVRNAVDHGIESPEERRRLAKPETGTIRIEAFQRSSEVWIVISDDGRGLQRAKILEKARARGLIRENATLHEEQILDLIFEPGFSTAESVTEVSGRGVGLDVVRKNVERLRGRVDALQRLALEIEVRMHGAGVAVEEIIEPARPRQERRRLFARHADGFAGLRRFEVGEVLAKPLRVLARRFEVPFANLTGGVARRLEPFGQRLLFQRQRPVSVLVHAKPLLVTPGQQSCARRHALRRGDVARRAAHAFAREPVEVRRADVPAHALHAEVGPALVVGEDDDHVGLPGGGGQPRKTQKTRKEERSELFHGVVPVCRFLPFLPLAFFSCLFTAFSSIPFHRWSSQRGGMFCAFHESQSA
jgi:two-component system chemotaxis sensor kinase CheA